MVLLLLGAPGSGKGTISNSLIANHDFKQISTGDLLREEVNSGSKLGKEIDEIIKTGKFVSSELVNNLVKDNINKYKKMGKNIVLDGYPRNIDQANFLATYCDIDKVVLIEVSNELIIKRIIARWTCPKCGIIYNTNSTPDYMPEVKKDGYYCKKCGAKLTQRKDDNIDTVKSRLDTYEQQTKPLINFYDKKGIIKKYNGEKITYDKIVKDIVS
ncbi:MAG: nucleoside monophosphate kinase [Mycoplasmataceae bacterium]|nr:nucleoside monophosphate kinase [Mycoplasmataceae bacterium]